MDKLKRYAIKNSGHNKINNIKMLRRDITSIFIGTLATDIAFDITTKSKFLSIENASIILGSTLFGAGIFYTGKFCVAEYKKFKRK